MMRYIYIGLISLSISFLISILPPQDLPKNTIITIDKNQSIGEVASVLKKKGIIKSVPLFKLFTRTIQSNSYYFDESKNLFSVISRLKNGKGNIPYVRITIPEGSNNEQIASLIWGKLEKFNAPSFLNEYREDQGYLFPDTYLFPINFDEEKVFSLMKGTFDRKVGKISLDTLKMAAIVEEEGKTETDRKMISDILWRRLAIGMPLQVDVAMETYKAKGFPKLPITNPGLESIRAAQNPTKNDYLYYITGKDGIFYYAKTFDEHKVNISKYLQK